MQRRNFLTALLAPLGLIGSPSASSSNRPGAVVSVDFQDYPAYLLEWLRQPMKPLSIPEDIPQHYQESAAPFLHAIRKGQQLEIIYTSGSTPGQIRTITPSLLFQKIDDTQSPTGAIYLLAHCHLRRHSRTFRLDAIKINGE